MGIIEVVGILIFAIIVNIILWRKGFYSWNYVGKKKRIENARKYDIWLREQGFEGLSEDDILSGNIPVDKIPMKIGDKTFQGFDEETKKALFDEFFGGSKSVEGSDRKGGGSN